MPSLIDFYNPHAAANAGDVPLVLTNLALPYQKGLLHLVYWMIYSQAGRDFLHENWPGKTVRGVVVTDAAMHAALKAKFDEYHLDQGARTALTGAHLAGVQWVDAYDKKRNGALAPAAADALMATAEAAFQQNMAAVSWLLWEQGTGELFPLGW